MTEAEAAIRNAIKALPEGLKSDWRGTNHYELTTSDERCGWFWLDLRDLDLSRDVLLDETPTGQKVGAVMDAASVLSRHGKTLLDELDRLRKKAGEP